MKQFIRSHQLNKQEFSTKSQDKHDQIGFPIEDAYGA